MRAPQPRFPPAHPYLDPPGCSVLDPHCDPNGGPAQDPNDRISPSFLGKSVKGAGIGAAVGLLAGAIFGYLRKSEIWKELPQKRYRIRVAASPLPDGRIALRFSIVI